MAEPAIANDLVEFFRADAGGGERAVNLHGRLEGIVFFQQVLEIKMHGAGNAPAAFGAVIDLEGVIGDALAGIFLRRTQVEQQALGLAQMRAHVVAADAHRRYSGRRLRIGDRREARNALRQRPPLHDPFAASAVEQLQLGMPGHGERPEGVAAELNGIAVQHDGRLRPDAEAAEQPRHRRGRYEIAVRFVPARRLPVEPQRARDMAGAVGHVVVQVADLDNAQIGIGEMIARARRWRRGTRKPSDVPYAGMANRIFRRTVSVSPASPASDPTPREYAQPPARSVAGTAAPGWTACAASAGSPRTRRAARARRSD